MVHKTPLLFHWSTTIKFWNATWFVREHFRPLCSLSATCVRSDMSRSQNSPHISRQDVFSNIHLQNQYILDVLRLARNYWFIDWLIHLLGAPPGGPDPAARVQVRTVRGQAHQDGRHEKAWRPLTQVCSETYRTKTCSNSGFRICIHLMRIWIQGFKYLWNRIRFLGFKYLQIRLDFFQTFTFLSEKSIFKNFGSGSRDLKNADPDPVTPKIQTQCGSVPKPCSNLQHFTTVLRISNHTWSRILLFTPKCLKFWTISSECI